MAAGPDHQDGGGKGGEQLMKFILLHRFAREKTGGTEPTWVNIYNINTIAACADGVGSRITMRDGFLIVSEEVNTVTDLILRAEN